ncbi:MAG: hypothetical protein K6T94_16530 [Paenibacillus sp.]|nr:hypothetical protein [Paenibacillus sp.]
MPNTSLNDSKKPEFVKETVNIINMLRSDFEKKRGLNRTQINIINQYSEKYPKENLKKEQWIKAKTMLTDIYIGIIVSQNNMLMKGEKIKDSDFEYFLKQLKLIEDML